MVSPPRALLSVSDKEGLVDFARGLRDLGFELIGTDGTAKILKEAGLPVTTVADYTGLREGLGGRVKTLHPRIFAGILAPTGDEKDLKDLGAVAIDLVIVNLYPFEATVAKPDVTVDEAVENIDIGGVSLIRAAAKNASRVAVVVGPARYRDVLQAWRDHKAIPGKLREELALEAFEYTSRYDAAIFNYLASRDGRPLPPALRLAYDKIADLGATPGPGTLVQQPDRPRRRSPGVDGIRAPSRRRDQAHEPLRGRDRADPRARVRGRARRESDLCLRRGRRRESHDRLAYGEGDEGGRPRRCHRPRVRAPGTRDLEGQEEGGLPDPADPRAVSEGARGRHDPRARRRDPPDDRIPRTPAGIVQSRDEGLADRRTDARHPLWDHRESLREIELNRPRARGTDRRHRGGPDEPGRRVHARLLQGERRRPRERGGERRLLPVPGWPR